MSEVTGKIVEKEGRSYYKIENPDRMEPFFINVVSDSDVVFFVSSRGGLTAGRRNSEGSIFPYETDDKIHQQRETGPKTIIRAGENVWVPFEVSSAPKPGIHRCLYKNIHGNSLLFEEENRELGMVFSYEWTSSEQYGMVRKSRLLNMGSKPQQIELVDGVQNILPAGVNPSLQEGTSCLVDSYRAVELLPGSEIGVFSMTTTINDSPSAVEMLQANVVWSTDRSHKGILLSSRQLDGFAAGAELNGETEVQGVKGAYFLWKECRLAPGQAAEWSIVLDVNHSHSQIAALDRQLQTSDFAFLQQSIEQSDKALDEIVRACDGVQNTADKVAQHHHYLNTLYNAMRGGLFIQGYRFDFADFEKFLLQRNKAVAQDAKALDRLRNCGTIQQAKAAAEGNADLYRLVLEYLPLSFSRRHGDPSRPWNKYNIALKDEQGNPIFNYEGNWRDIFQNWEALSLSYPEFLENMVAKFVNASTADGYNPYRINREGIDWERVEEDNPFAGLGYWGDHQIIYLAKLLEQLEAHYPGWVADNLSSQVYSYGNLPYEIVPYQQILKDSKNTIRFNFAKDRQVMELSEQMGSDGKLMLKDGRVYHVSLLEKLAVPVLAKICNLLPGGGIWMNTQRPEWNDANNAIVGIGLSMVTVYQLYQYLQFLRKTLGNAQGSAEVSAEVADWMEQVAAILQKYSSRVDQAGAEMLHEMGEAFSEYREKLYQQGFSGVKMVETSKLAELIEAVLPYLEYTIEQNKGELFTSYNLLQKDFTAAPMRDMLEGQSAVIGSGYLTAAQTADLLQAMYDSSLYSPQQKNFYLYPVQKVKPFMQRNLVNLEGLQEDGLVLVKDCQGNLRFQRSLATEAELEKALEKSSYTEGQKQEIRSAYEQVFGHRKFTGRSQVMYKYEGIGCVYWHQNAKLALAVQDMLVREYCENGNSPEAQRLAELYKQLMNGMLYRKTPAELGAFPLEPYSHSSFIGKAEQPGMTGQVKESVIARRRELGVLVNEGKISFHPYFVNPEEFLTTPDSFCLEGEAGCLPLQPGSLAFTIYRTPVVYHKTGKNRVEVQFADGSRQEFDTLELPQEVSARVFRNDGVKSIRVEF